MKQEEILKIARILTENPELFGFMRIAASLPGELVKQMVERMAAE